jgi:hypothetical protein
VSWGGSLVEPMPSSIFPPDGLNQQLAGHVTSTGSSANTTHIYTKVNLYLLYLFIYLFICLFVSKVAKALSAYKS